MDQIRFVVSLDTISLGIVLFDVSWKRSGEITLQGLVETQAACDFMNKNMSLLLERLQGLGYRVHNLGCVSAGCGRDAGQTSYFSGTASNTSYRD